MNKANEYLQTITQMAENLKGLMDEQMRQINQLHPQERAKMANIMGEIEKIKKDIQEGKSDEIDKILKKYASSNT